MSSNMRSDCRKFAPNIFNKSKCTNCFRQKEEHSAEALESNRATRKVSKCGYLFVAPGWDFSNPLNRTKRWQRRWFVLYDDGELSYSVDEHPDTVPQASIDMNKVVEVTDAEEVTGNAHSLSVTASDRVHFVKATCREEYRWWADVLSVFPRTKGRHKRNATFPGVQPLSVSQQSTPVRSTTPSDARPRFNSCLSEPRKPTPAWTPEEPAIVLTRDVTPTPVEPKAVAETYRDLPASSNSPPTRDKIHPDDKSRTRRVANRERRGVKSGRSFSEDFSGMLPSWRERKATSTDAPGETTTPTTPTRTIYDEYDDSRREEKLKDIADSLTRPRYKRHTQSRSGAYTVRPTRDGDNSEEERKGFGRPASPANLRGADQLDAADKPVRGDPDGCGLDINMQRYSPSSERRVELPAEDLLNIKKGWLMKQAPNQDWVKHWFVLRGAALMYYRDPTAEDKGIMDGVIDLSGVSSVAEVLVARNYGFQTLLWDERRYVLSAVTAGIRCNWMAAIRKAAGLKDPLVDSPLILEKKERDLLSSPALSVSCSERDASIASSTPLTPRSIHFSSDEEYRTASEGGRRESQDWGEPLTALPPSPPLNRTPISRVKEKARSRTSGKAGVFKRSKSSPPASRRSTLDSVVPDDLILASCGELPESETDDGAGGDSSKSSLLTIESCPSEVAELKLQLNVALREVSEAEQERLKLRHCRGEVVGLEKQVKQLLSTIEQTEVQLAKKTKEVEEVESLRKRYNKLLKDHEEILAQWRQQTMEEDWKDLYKQMQERHRSEGDAWQRKLVDADSLAEEATTRYEALARELAAERGSIEHLHCEVISLSERLAQGIEENDSLYRRVRELEGRGSRNSLSISRERGRSVDSLSDLTNIDLDLNVDGMDKERIAEEYEDLRGRFEKAVQEIRAMKRELRESHALYDDLELMCISARQDAQGQTQSHTAQTELMVARIDDLTLKLSAAEKQVRGLKQKNAKSDSREKRRSLSLKGRESFQIGKELEEKLAELEAKIGALETGLPNSEKPKSPRVSRSESPQTLEKEKKSLKASRLRRKSLDSATSSEPMKVLIRLSSLEAKVAKAAERAKQGCAGESGKTTSPKCLPRTKKHLQPVEVSIDRASEDREGSLECQQSVNAGELTDTARCVVDRLESLLKAKLVELSDRRKSLRESGLFDKGARMRLLAEKLAYESILVSKIAQAVASSNQDSESFRNIVVEGEIIESCRLINLLKSSLNGVDIREANEPCETPTEHLTRLLTERLVLVNQQVASPSTSEVCNRSTKCRISPEQLEFIRQKQHELEDYIKDYRETKLEQLARALALETLSLTNDSDGRSSSPSDQEAPRSIEDRRIREAWAMAQETVNRELIQAEISHVIMRCGQNYEASLESEQKTNFSLLGSQRLMLEQWVDCVEQILQQEMEAGIEALTVHYEHCLESLMQEKSRPMAYSDEDVRESRKLLAEFADISAQKALIDARISVIFQKVCASSSAPSSRQSKSDFMLQLLENESDIHKLSSTASDDIADSEFQILFNQFSETCLTAIAPASLRNQMDDPETELSMFEVTAALSQVQSELRSLQNFVSKEFSVPSLQHETDIVEDASQETSWKSVCVKCSILCQQISSITNCLLEGLECQRCSQLQESIHTLSSEHDEELRKLRESQEQEMASLHGDLEKQRHSLVSQHEEEQAQLKERARRLERRLGTLDSEYMQQVDNLRDAYHKTLSAGLERNIDGEENIRQRYQAEIEQLKALCEKGLAAMESSHRRIITEMEDKHRQELEQSRLEKEQALAEETQATLAALDAMRKAHETEVQKEIAKFKAEFVRKMHSAQDVSALQKDQEAEMAEIKEEILSLSEKYSVKCVESASFEDQLGVVSKKLADAQQHILQLDSRNKQLRAHLANEASELETADAAHLLRRKSRELEQKCEEYGQLQKKLNVVSNHGEELSALCSRLRDEYLYAERSCTGNPVLLAKLWDKVQQLATSWPLPSKGAKVGASFRPRSEGASPTYSSKNKQFKEPSALSSAELIWSPRASCSRSSSPFSYVSPLHSPSPCPLSGMVAERKKIFEP